MKELPLDAPMVITTLATFLGFPLFWCLFFEGFSIRSARQGYVVLGSALTILALLYGLALRDPAAIGWFFLGLAHAAFGQWGIPVLSFLFSGKADHRVNQLFRG